MLFHLHNLLLLPGWQAQKYAFLFWTFLPYPRSFSYNLDFSVSYESLLFFPHKLPDYWGSGYHQKGNLILFPMHTVYASGYHAQDAPQEKKEPLISCNCWTAWKPQLRSSSATPYKHGPAHLNLILKVQISENPSVILASRNLFSGGRWQTISLKVNFSGFGR